MSNRGTKANGKAMPAARTTRAAGERKYREVEGADFKLWNPDVTETVEGRFLGFASGKFGAEANVRIERDGHIETWNAPTILHDRLSQVSVGSFVRLTSRGWIETKDKDRPAMDYKVEAEA